MTMDGLVIGNTTTVVNATAPDANRELRAVAEKFEALFAHLLLKNMRAASPGDGLFDSEQSRLYQDLMDQEMAEAMSERGGLGIADMLVEQLGQGPSVARVPHSPVRHFRPPVAGAVTDVTADLMSAPDATPPAVTVASAAPTATSFETPAAFVKAIWPLAQQAASTLRVAPQMIVAQAALETGWGKHAPATADGGASHNFFGIKAGAGWDGDRTDVSTTEVIGGVARRVVAAFRRYGSMAEGVADYTRFLLTSSRYRDALNTGDDGAAFARALQEGGYATDPNYAAKILTIANGDTLKNALETLKNAR